MPRCFCPGREQFCQEAVHIRVAVSGPQGKAFLQGLALMRCKPCDTAPVRIDSFGHPQGCFLRDFAGEAEPHRGAHGIFVGPGPETASGIVLLHGGKAVLQNSFGGLCQTFLHMRVMHRAHRAEIQQLGTTRRIQNDIIRADVPVDDSVFVDYRQRFHHRPQDPESLVHTEPAASVMNIFCQIHTLDKLHNNIGSIVFFHEVQDFYDLGDILKLCQGIGFPEEPVPAFFIVGDHASGYAAYLCGYRAVPVYQAAGEEFLQRHLLLGQVVPGKVGDTEAALAQNPACLVTLPQLSADGELMFIILAVFRIAAIRADPCLDLFHTAYAAHCHDFIPFLPFLPVYIRFAAKARKSPTKWQL